MKQAINELADVLENFVAKLREIDETPQDARPAGVGEYPFGEDDDDNVVQLGQAQARDDGVNDDTPITMKSGDLRKVIDSYRKFHRYARTGKTPTPDERYEWGAAIRAVKHLIRTPNRKWA